MVFSSKAVSAMPVSSSFSRRAFVETPDAIVKELESALDKDAEAAVQGTHRCCAERRLLDSYIRQGRRAGVPPHKLIAYVRRKLGSSIAVWRRTADGALACAAPCLFCARELRRFDLRVHCSLDGQGGWFSGRLSEPGAPPPLLTGGQESVLRRQGWQLCRQPRPPGGEQQPLPAAAEPAQGQLGQRPKGRQPGKRWQR
ncbi:hypothetical protein ABPG75_011380 [Micractinium tetrahymenae]